jgi:phosphinothricin acetyltransferase
LRVDASLTSATFALSQQQAAVTQQLIRLATPDDIPAIQPIYAHAVLHGTASWEWTPPDEAELARRMAAIRDAGFPYLVAEAEGRVLGYAYAGAYRPRAAYRWTCEDSIYIAPNAQGRGVGRLLLAALIEQCTGVGLRQMVAVIGDQNSQPSIRLHAALGFTHSGLIRSAGFKQGRWLDQVLMQRPLGSGDGELPPSLA